MSVVLNDLFSFLEPRHGKDNVCPEFVLLNRRKAKESVAFRLMTSCVAF
jgi:hypothetical protein